LDGIPNVLAEAMAMKLPVVSTTVSAIPELVQDQVNGLLVPPRDEKGLAAALARLLDDPLLRIELGEKGWQTVTEKFNVEQNVRLVYDVFMSQGGSDHASQ
jgi:glycosyltransferase involved in cell wall biosynthesis